MTIFRILFVCLIILSKKGRVHECIHMARLKLLQTTLNVYVQLSAHDPATPRTFSSDVSNELPNFPFDSTTFWEQVIPPFLSSPSASKNEKRLVWPRCTLACTESHFCNLKTQVWTHHLMDSLSKGLCFTSGGHKSENPSEH